MTDAVFTDNRKDGRFEYHTGGLMAYAAYRLDGSVLTISYVEAPPALRGTGAAGQLMQKVMETARDKGYTVVPVCSYAAAWIRRSGAFQDLVA